MFSDKNKNNTQNYTSYNQYTNQSNSNFDLSHYIGYARSSLLAFTKAGSLSLSNLGNITRYLAYSSDIGESFRPVVNKNLVRACYGISWTYVGYDVYSFYNSSNKKNYELYKSTLQRATFQTFASMLFPALTIHQSVHFASKGFAKLQTKNLIKNQKLIMWGPTACGFMIVPFLPYIFDEPVEHSVEWFFNKLP